MAIPQKGTTAWYNYMRFEINKNIRPVMEWRMGEAIKIINRSMRDNFVRQYPIEMKDAFSANSLNYLPEWMKKPPEEKGEPTIYMAQQTYDRYVEAIGKPVGIEINMAEKTPIKIFPIKTLDLQTLSKENFAFIKLFEDGHKASIRFKKMIKDEAAENTKTLPRDIIDKTIFLRKENAIVHVKKVNQGWVTLGGCSRFVDDSKTSRTRQKITFTSLMEMDHVILDEAFLHKYPFLKLHTFYNIDGTYCTIGDQTISFYLKNAIAIPCELGYMGMR